MHTKKINTFCYEIEQIIISSRTAGSTLQKRLLLYKTQKKTNVYVLLISLIMLNFVIQCLYDIQITTNKFFVKQACIRACVVSLYFKIFTNRNRKNCLKNK
jgi:hypothetical protein